MINKPNTLFLCLITVVVLAVPAFGQGAAIEPCPATPAPARPNTTQARPETRARLLTVDSSIPDDPEVLKIIAPYEDKVRQLSKVIGLLEGGLSKTGVGGGSLGNFVTDAIRAQAEAKLGKPIVLAMVNNGGLRKNEIAAGELRASDIFELLPFENALILLDVTGAQLTKILQVVTRDAQSGARIQFKWNDRDRPEFISGKLVDANGKEQEIDPNQTYTIITIDYLMSLKSGVYAILQEGKNPTPLNLTIRDAVMNYVKAETAAGRPVRSVVDNRFVQVGPGPKNAEAPR
ncbi:MAG TPA: 5'-nucleotidase C-terminal domain-containing protein [Pyrinomonadaceae bacterium]|nr:5'-nucleotidase C-terminal domain-containing protein [Pyrinomonadaceae bacterium]